MKGVGRVVIANLGHISRVTHEVGGHHSASVSGVTPASATFEDRYAGAPSWHSKPSGKSTQSGLERAKMKRRTSGQKVGWSKVPPAIAQRLGKSSRVQLTVVPQLGQNSFSSHRPVSDWIRTS